MLGSEYRLIAKILIDKDLRTVEKLKITKDFFKTEECRRAFEYLKDHYNNKNTYGHLPSFELFLERFPGFPPNQDVEDSIETLCEDVRKKYMLAQGVKIYERIGNYISVADPYAMSEFLRDASIQLSAEHEINDDLTLNSSKDQLIEMYNRTKENKGCNGTPWLWPTLTEWTGGKQRGQFIYLRGQTGSGKSTIVTGDAVNSNEKYNSKVLYFALEMENIKVNRMAACFRAGIDLEKCVRGQLNPFEEKLYRDTLELLASQEKITWLTTCGQGSTNISSLDIKIREFDPDEVIVDTTYQLADDGKKIDMDWRIILNVSRKIKQMQKNHKITNPPRSYCLTALIQSNQDDDIALSKQIKQDCDVSLKINQEFDEDLKETYLKITADKIRDLPLVHGRSFCINFKPGIDLSERVPYEKRNEIGKGKPMLKAPNTGTSFSFGGKRA